MTADSALTVPDRIDSKAGSCTAKQDCFFIEASSSPKALPAGHKPWLYLAIPSLSFAGVQLAWAVLTGHATAHLRTLGLSDKLVGLAWLGGPVTGTIVQPIIGVLSDRCTSRFGRRRPFMLGGAGLTAIGLVLFSSSQRLARMVGAAERGSVALNIGVLTFWIADVAVNILQGPTRALLADTTPDGQLALGSCFFAVANGAGKAVGFGLGALVDGIEKVFGIAALLIVLLTGACCYVIEEERLYESEAQSFARLLRHTVRECGSALRDMPSEIRRVFAVQWLTYLSLMLLFIYGADWVGKEVFGGSGDAARGSVKRELFDAGVRYGNAALFGMAVGCMVTAPIMLILARRLGVRSVWAGSLAIVACSFALAVNAGRVMAAVMMTSWCFAAAAALTIPWTLVSAMLTGERAKRKGVYLASFNLAQATPGLVASTLGSVIVHLWGLPAVMVAVSVSAALATAATATVSLPRGIGRRLGLPEPEPEPEHEHEHDERDACPRAAV
ncbi:Sucrose transport protein SUC2 [Gracilariopsis chorda]|uniref:Sucrose transport protein SUC2 n=1 Tax=Gracilariopsis chorda TaxID=448386 RepID=A0A2V3J543_9FLOR|nr:Sucrose transport protein SUC2 [Gracilariopsis chorda]|eukprot:PXF49117.1 Sucrose transport protein SUC2 [Gracilariopsis chorda]